MPSSIQLKRGTAEACMSYTGYPNELILDMSLHCARVCSNSGNDPLPPGELMTIYRANGYQFFWLKKPSRNYPVLMRHVVIYKPDTPYVTLKFLRGSTKSVRNYVGRPGEIVHDLDTDTLYLHDGEAVGGFQL